MEEASNKMICVILVMFFSKKQKKPGQYCLYFYEYIHINVHRKMSEKINTKLVIIGLGRVQKGSGDGQTWL